MAYVVVRLLVLTIRTDIKVLEKKFEELESRLTLKNPSQGLTLTELANLQASQISEKMSEDEARQNKRLQIQLEKEKALRQRFQLEAQNARKELNNKLQEEREILKSHGIQGPSKVLEDDLSYQSESSTELENLTSEHNDPVVVSGATSRYDYKTPSIEVEPGNIEQTNSNFVKPKGTVPKSTSYNLKLKTLRSSKYTPKKQKLTRNLFRCSSPIQSVMSEFDARLVNSAVLDETREIEDLLLDEASSMCTNDHLNMTVSSIRTLTPQATGSEYPRVSDHGCRDFGAGDAHLLVKNSQCPGCQPPATIGGKLLNSRTYNIVLENDPHTCDDHRSLRNTERRLARAINSSKRGNNNPVKRIIERKSVPDSPVGTDVYSLPSTGQNVTPFGSASSDNISSLTAKTRDSRRLKVPFTKEEEQNLNCGVQQLGKFWTQILNTYAFHPSRTCVDLKDKFRNMRHTKAISPGSAETTRRKPQPFSMAEERRLRRGVKHFGSNWSAILRIYKFHRGRTAVDLKDKWRNMTRAKCLTK